MLTHCFPNFGQVKHILTEMYQATIKSFSGRLLKMVNDALLPAIYFNVDGWKVRYPETNFWVRDKLKEARDSLSYLTLATFSCVNVVDISVEAG